MAGKWRAYLPGQDLIPGKFVAGPRGLGTLAQNVPATGTSGGALLRQGSSPTLTFPADTDVEVRAQIITPPASGVLFVDNDSSAIYGNPVPGVYTATMKYWRAGVDMGNFTATFIIGSVVNLDGAINALAFSGSVGSPPPAASMTGQVNALAFSGSAGASPLATMSGSLNAMTFIGAAGTGPAAVLNASINALSFTGSAGSVGTAGTLRSGWLTNNAGEHHAGATFTCTVLDLETNGVVLVKTGLVPQLDDDGEHYFYSFQDEAIVRGNYYGLWHERQDIGSHGAHGLEIVRAT